MDSAPLAAALVAASTAIADALAIDIGASRAG
jgi:hypothetical protein